MLDIPFTTFSNQVLTVVIGGALLVFITLIIGDLLSNFIRWGGW